MALLRRQPHVVSCVVTSKFSRFPAALGFDRYLVQVSAWRRAKLVGMALAQADMGEGVVLGTNPPT
jgi:hypothetical protein